MIDAATQQGTLPGMAMRRVLLAGLLALFALPAAAEDAAYRIAPPPAWVTPIDPGHGGERDLAGHGASFHHLADVQVDVRSGRFEEYQHYAVEALSPAGVESIASLQIDFDPTYQELVLHAVSVHRGGQRLDKLAGARVELLQRERGLEEQIYDGRRTASLVLADVRVGDVVEYAFTVSGYNPVFGGVPHGSVRRSWAEPVGRVHTRLLTDGDGALAVSTRNESIAPLRRQLGTAQEIVWDAVDVPALDVPDASPSWYFPWAFVQWSGHADWQAVARWAQPLYQVPQPLDPEVRELAAAIAASHPAPAERLLAALRFVQGEIRYLGVEVGAGSHAPRAPGEVLARRFGDCKDKTLLLLALLGELGIEASAALVLGSQLRAGDEPLPSPGAFDHVIVLARLEGREIWLDPTWSPQGGSTLQDLVQPDYGLALPVSGDTRRLVPMHDTPPLRELATIRVEIDASGGVHEDVGYTVTTIRSGPTADRDRNAWADDGPATLGKQYLDFYGNYYRGIRSDGPLQSEDDPFRNRFTTIERYRIPNAWTRVESASRFELDAGIHDLLDRLPSSSGIRPGAPVAIQGPIDVTQVTELRLHERWSVEPGTMRIEHAAFSLDRTTEVGDRLIRFTDRLRTHIDHVPADQVASFTEKLAAVENELSDVLYYGDPAAGPAATGINWTVLMAMLLAATLGLVVAVPLYRWDPAPAAPTSPALAGIRGWLLLPALGVGLGPIAYAIATWGNVKMLDTGSWRWLTTPGSEGYHALWAPAMLLDLMATVLLGLLSCLLLLVFFARRRSTPAIYIGLSVLAVLHQVVNAGLLQMLPVETGERAQAIGRVVGSALVTALWCGYFLNSDRVRATFVRRYREPIAPQRPPPVTAGAHPDTVSPPPAEARVPAQA